MKRCKSLTRPKVPPPPPPSKQDPPISQSPGGSFSSCNIQQVTSTNSPQQEGPPPPPPPHGVPSQQHITPALFSSTTVPHPPIPPPRSAKTKIMNDYDEVPFEPVCNNTLPKSNDQAMNDFHAGGLSNACVESSVKSSDDDDQSKVQEPPRSLPLSTSSMLSISSQCTDKSPKSPSPPPLPTTSPPPLSPTSDDEIILTAPTSNQVENQEELQVQDEQPQSKVNEEHEVMEQRSYDEDCKPKESEEPPPQRGQECQNEAIKVNYQTFGLDFIFTSLKS